MCGILGVVALVATYYFIRPTLPDVDQLKDVQLQVPLRIYTADGRLMEVFGEKRRTPYDLEEIPACLRHAFLAGEDARFYEHPGFDYQGIARAVWHLVKTGGDRGIGGSTITQQLARDFGFVSRKKLFTRKLKEIFLALKIETELSKDEIFELYLNKIYLGNRAYGIGAASHAYYGKRPDELSVAECAMIAALPKAPSRINPINNPPRALERRNYVLGRMRDLDYIDEPTFREAVDARDFAFPHEPEVEVEAPYAAELARQAVIEMLGDDAYTGGYEVYTTFESRLQLAAAQAVREGLAAYDRRHGYRGPAGRHELPASGSTADFDAILDGYEVMGNMEPALVIEADEVLALAYLPDGQTITLDLEAVKWARPHVDVNRVGARPEAVTDVIAVGDVIRVARGADGSWGMTQVPEVEGALVSIAPADGAMLAIVGGFDFGKSKFNRAVQARRQPGSSFKAFVYAAALTEGFSPATLVNDAPVVFESDALEGIWRPENYSQQFYGPTRLREGMVNSRNLVSIRVLQSVGIETVWSYVRRFGFEPDEIPRDLSMALGSGGVYPLTMARAYAMLGNGGFAVEPYLVRRVVDGSGRPVYEADPLVACPTCDLEVNENSLASIDPLAGDENLPVTEEGAPPDRAAPRVMDAATHYMITSMLRDVVRRGTGRKALELGRSDLAGKTGTTNEQRDAWFSGFNDAVATTAWVGFDVPSTLGRGEVGGRAALPIWIDYMREALDGVPETPLEPPEDIVFARIDPETGQLAAAGDPNSIVEVFRRGELPEAATVASDGEEEEANPYDIF
ncbi:MAG: penicillin-binding protein 1A [Pseudomonadota bacterium]